MTKDAARRSIRSFGGTSNLYLIWTIRPGFVKYGQNEEKKSAGIVFDSSPGQLMKNRAR
jgi:hypothetical protein